MNSEDIVRFLNVQSMLKAFWCRELKALRLDSVSWAVVNERGRGIARGSSGNGLDSVCWLFHWRIAWVRKGILSLPIPTDGFGESLLAEASHVIWTSSNLAGRGFKRAEIWSREGTRRVGLVGKRLGDGLSWTKRKSTRSTHVWGTSLAWLSVHDSKRARGDSSPGEGRDHDVRSA